MAKGIDLSIAADTRSAMSAIQRGIIDPLEDVTELLETTGRESKDAGNDLERSMRDAQRRTEDAKDEIRDLRDELNKAGRSAKDVGDGAGGMRRLKDGAEEVTQEVGQNLGEAVSSIRGDIGDLGQVGQDTLGGLAATLASTGPAGIVGAAALAAAAIGVGGLTGQQQKLNEQVQHMKEYFADAWREAAEGGRNYMDLAGQIAEQNDIRFNPDRAEEYKQMLEDANTLGLDRNTLIEAATGNQAAYNVVIERANKLIDEQNNKPRQDGFLGTAEWDKQMKRLDGVRDKFAEIGAANDDAKAKAAEAAASTSAQLMRLVEDADEAAVSVDELGNKMIELPTGETVYINAETKQATLNLDTFKGDADGVIDHVNRRDIKLRVTTDTTSAERSLRGLIEKGRVIKIGTRIVGPGGGWD